MLISVMHTATSALQVPVVVLLMILAVVMIVMVGMLVAEFFTERRYFKLSIPDLVDDLRHSSDPEAVIRESGMLRRQKNALFELLNHPDATPSAREAMAVNIVAQEQAIFDNRVKVSDFISKVGPMLGLMGTLIPLGPGVIAIGVGDTQTLSDSLLVAFDTTITGLVVAALALLVSTIRKSWYAKYNAAFEAACEIVFEKANEGASLKTAYKVPGGAAQPYEGFGDVGAAAPFEAAPTSAIVYGSQGEVAHPIAGFPRTDEVPSASTAVYGAHAKAPYPYAGFEDVEENSVNGASSDTFGPIDYGMADWPTGEGASRGLDEPIEADLPDREVERERAIPIEISFKERDYD